MSMRRWCGLGRLGVVAALGLGACRSAPPSTAFTLTGAEYPAVFDRAKDVLRESGFTLDRVDAAAGVIETSRAPSAGLLTPWTPHSGGLGDAWRGTVRPERRRARVTFRASGEPPATDDLRAHDGEIAGEVAVDLFRVHRPWRRLDMTSIRFSSTAFDPVAVQRGASGVVEYAAGEDDRLAGGLADRIRGGTP